MKTFTKPKRRAFVRSAAMIGLALVAASCSTRQLTGVVFEVNLSPVDLPLKETFPDRKADRKTVKIVEAADAFLGALDERQRQAASYAFSDNAQRSNWSNFPEGMIPRGGLKIGTLSPRQYQLMDALIAEIMSEEGVQNLEYQLAAERTFPTDDWIGQYGVDNFYIAFLGEPSKTQPWMFQFGGHHLGINVTIYGADTEFSPMLTGGQPLTIDYEGQQVFITEDEVNAAQALLNSLSAEQKAVAVRGNRPINLLLGPGEFGTVVAPEGIKGSDLNDRQRKLLIALVKTRIGFINKDDQFAKMASVMSELDDTYFG